MIQSHKTYSIIWLSSLLLLACQSTAVTQSSQSNVLLESTPNWVSAKPVSNLYYYGIGNALFTNADYQATARDEALADMASEISVKLSSNSILYQFENDNDFIETYRNTIEASTSKVIEGHELVESWTDEKQFWSLYRLSKEEYARQLRRKKSTALSIGLTAFELAQSQLNKSPVNAFSNYCHCLEAIEKYLGEETKVFTNTKEIDLGSSCFAKLQHLSANLNIAIPSEVTRPRRSQSDVLFRVTVTISNTPFQNLPIELFDGFRYFRKPVQSEGSLNVTASEVSPKSKLVTLRPTFISLNSTESPIVSQLVKNLTTPKVEVRLLSAKVRLYVESEEYNLGVKRSESLTASHLKSELTSLGYNLVGHPEKSDIIISIKAHTRKGTEFSGLHTTYLDVEVSALESSTKKEIYSNSIQSIKGINLTYERAGLKAFSNSRHKLKVDIAEDIIKHF